MNYGYMVVYQKCNNDIIYRACKTKPEHHKGDITSMGWKVLDIQRLYNGKCYPTYEFDNLLNRKGRIHNIFININKSHIAKICEMTIILTIIKFFI